MAAARRRDVLEVDAVVVRGQASLGVVSGPGCAVLQSEVERSISGAQQARRPAVSDAEARGGRNRGDGPRPHTYISLNHPSQPPRARHSLKKRAPPGRGSRLGIVPRSMIARYAATEAFARRGPELPCAAQAIGRYSLAGS